jgi:hypothetical protein
MTEEEITTILEDMVADPRMSTKAAYRANTILYPENSISFIDAHLQYLKQHPKLNPQHYLANLRLMIKVRG